MILNQQASMKQVKKSVQLNGQSQTCFYAGSLTNFSQQDKTWAEFSTLEVAICMLQIYGAIESNCLTKT
jgi:hypothetical protein